MYDIETLPTLDKVYLVGFYDGETYRHWESAPMRPEDEGSAVDQFMRWVLNSWAHRKAWVWGHNAGSFDALYLVAWLHKFRNVRSIEVIPLQSSILQMQVPSQSGCKVTFLDTYRLMSASLDKLGEAFGLGGKVQGVDYNTLHLDPRRYGYLERDCRLLYDCLGHFRRLIEDSGGELAITAPSTAMKSFRRTHLHHPIPRHVDVHEFTRQGYYGGRVEVFQESFGEHGSFSRLNVYDFNSMYPAAMLGDMPVELAYDIKDSTTEQFQAYKRMWLGFVECTIQMPNNLHIPPLPFRHEGKLIFPVGTFKGIWSSIELECALECGAKVLRWGRAIWFRGKPVFRDFVTHWYAYRDKTAPGYSLALDHTAKLMLNSLYGKTGMNPAREKLWLFPTEKDHAEHQMTPLLHVEQGVWIEDVEVSAPYIIPHLAAWVTALARVNLWRTMQSAQDVWYCDTDSIFTTAELPTSGKLGGLKLEYQAVSAQFAAPKMYALQLADGTDKVKMKGFSAGFGGPKLTRDSFDSVMRGEYLTINRQTKLREGIRSDQQWPAMKKVAKRMVSKDTKRVHIADGMTQPIRLELG